MKIKRAIISVSNKDRIVEFARELATMGVEIISTGGTAKTLKDAGVPVIEVSKYTKSPEMMGGRVKTLNPKISGGILARRDNVSDMEEANKYHIGMIDLVVVNLYPFEETITKPNVTFADAIENIDIGGPTMLRGGSKNFKDVIVVIDPADYRGIIHDLKAKGDISQEVRMHLSKKVFGSTSRYDAAICKYLSEQMGIKIETLFLEDGRVLAYAENRDQDPALLFDGGSDYTLSPTKMKVESGNPSYTATADSDGIIQIMCKISEAFRIWKGDIPYIAVVGKHGNPCGAAIDWYSPKMALIGALLGDPRAAMGGELVVNFPVGDELAREIFEVNSRIKIGRDKWGMDVIIAPKFSPPAVELLGKREKRRLLSNVNLKWNAIPYNGKWQWRFASGDFLAQKPSSFIFTPDQAVCWTGATVNDYQVENIIIAWAVCWSASSNTVALAKDKMLIALGCGGQDRVGCVRLCLDKANQSGHSTKGAVFASDGFFPYATSSSSYDKIEALLSDMQIKKKGEDIRPHDMLMRFDEIVAKARCLDQREGTELLIDAGCIGGIVPADGKELENVKARFNEAGLAVAFVAKEHRGFSKH